MTGVLIAAGIATLVLLVALAGGHGGRGAKDRLLAGSVLLPGVTIACAAVILATWIPSAADPPRWVSAIASVCVAAMFLLAVARYRPHGRSTSRSRR